MNFGNRQGLRAIPGDERTHVDGYIVDGEKKLDEEEIVADLILKLSTSRFMEGAHGLRILWRRNRNCLRNSDLFDAIGTAMATKNKDVMFLAKKITSPEFGAPCEWFSSDAQFFTSLVNILSRCNFEPVTDETAHDFGDPSVLRNLGKVLANVIGARPEHVMVLFQNRIINRMIAISAWLKSCDGDEVQAKSLEELPYETARQNYMTRNHTLLMGLVGLQWFEGALLGWYENETVPSEAKELLQQVISPEMIVHFFGECVNFPSRYLRNETLKVIEWCLCCNRSLARYFSCGPFLGLLVSFLRDGPVFQNVSLVPRCVLKKVGTFRSARKFTFPAFFAMGIMKQLASVPEGRVALAGSPILEFNPFEDMAHSDIFLQFLSVLRRLGAHDLETALLIMDMPFVRLAIQERDDFDAETKRMLAKLIGKFLLQYGKQYHEKLLTICDDYVTFVIECMQISASENFVELSCHVLAYVFALSGGNLDLFHAFFEQIEEIQSSIAEESKSQELLSILGPIIMAGQ